MVSNAELRSSRMRMDIRPESDARRRSLVILSSAVSVEWRGGNQTGIVRRDYWMKGEHGAEKQHFFQGSWREMEGWK